MAEENPNPQDQNNPNAASSDFDDVDELLTEASELTDSVAHEVGLDTSNRKSEFQLDPGDTRRPEADVESQIDQISDMVNEMADAEPSLLSPDPVKPIAEPKPEKPAATEPALEKEEPITPPEDITPITDDSSEQQQRLNEALEISESAPPSKPKTTIRDIMNETRDLSQSALKTTVQGFFTGLDFLDDVFSFVSYDARKMIGWAAVVFAIAAASITAVSWS